MDICNFSKSLKRDIVSKRLVVLPLMEVDHDRKLRMSEILQV